ncbi:MAG: hypothetical protein DI626_09870 [Micavibrio aeruginosavorus]|uniref:Acyl-homoserine-lactone synthase n=1 Tax=Micavibrio aeruginosavorus TaxID=349221 RepID=A0A2W5BN14_9BACT|nr:MAG: hypothetical protein DI626_09870 [Micavibrio aeruginosavorus]
MNFYPDNVLAAAFDLRYKETSDLGWSDGLTFQKQPRSVLFSEADDQDKPGTVYFVQKEAFHSIDGVVRISPSVDLNGRPISMIHQSFGDLIYPGKEVPTGNDIWETSRLIIDQNVFCTRETREPLVNRLLSSSFFYAHSKGIKALFCFMPEKVWPRTYERMGLEVERLGPNREINDLGKIYNVYAGIMHIDDAVISRIEKNTGLTADILDYGAVPMTPVFLERPYAFQPRPAGG